MTRTTAPAPGTAATPPADNPAALSDESTAAPDPGELFADGVKVRDTDGVGAMTPDTDPPETEPTG